MNLNEIRIRFNGYDYYIDPDDIERTALMAIEDAYEEGQEDHECDHDDCYDECDENHDGVSLWKIEDTVERMQSDIVLGTTLADKSPSEVLDELVWRIQEAS